MKNLKFAILDFARNTFHLFFCSKHVFFDLQSFRAEEEYSPGLGVAHHDDLAVQEVLDGGGVAPPLGGPGVHLQVGAAPVHRVEYSSASHNGIIMD